MFILELLAVHEPQNQNALIERNDAQIGDVKLSIPQVGEDVLKGVNSDVITIPITITIPILTTTGDPIVESATAGVCYLLT